MNDANNLDVKCFVDFISPKNMVAPPTEAVIRDLLAEYLPGM